MQHRIITHILLLLLSLPAWSQQTIVQGVAPQFAGETVVFNHTTNPFTQSEEPFAKGVVQEDGTFTIPMDMERPTWLYLNQGIYRIKLLAVPGMAYSIYMPPNQPKNEGDIRNPFFQPLIYHARIIKEEGLESPLPFPGYVSINQNIFRFDTLLNNVNRLMMEQRRAQLSVQSDSMLRAIESTFRGEDSPYFRKYRFRKYGLFKLNSKDAGLQIIKDQYLNAHRPEPYDPAYMDLFNEMFDEFLFYYGRTSEGKDLGYIINRLQDPDSLISAILRHPAIHGVEEAKFLIIHQAATLYNKSYFQKEAFERILIKLGNDSVNLLYARFSEEVLDNLTRLKPGTTPPDFLLKDLEGNSRSLQDFRGRYVYLNFCTPDNYSCLKEYPFMDALHRAHKDRLAIVTIMVTSSFTEMVEFMKKNRHHWSALFYGNDDQLLKNYDVKAYPAGFLLDREGKMILSPAPLPTEGIEQQLYNVMRSRGDLTIE